MTSGEAPIEAGSRAEAGKPVAVVFALALGLVLGSGAGAFALGPFVAKRLAEPTPVKGEGEGRVGGGKGHGGGPVVHVMDGLVVNPAGSEGTRFLVATVAIEVDAPGAGEELAARDAEVRDAVLRVLGGKTVAQLVDVSAREALKEELRAAAAALLEEGQVRRIYLPQFVIQ